MFRKQCKRRLKKKKKKMQDVGSAKHASFISFALLTTCKRIWGGRTRRTNDHQLWNLNKYKCWFEISIFNEVGVGGTIVFWRERERERVQRFGSHGSNSYLSFRHFYSLSNSHSLSVCCFLQSLCLFGYLEVGICVSTQKRGMNFLHILLLYNIWVIFQFSLWDFL